MRCALLLLLACLMSVAQQLPGTARLDMNGDIAEQMVNGIIRHLERATTASAIYSKAVGRTAAIHPGRDGYANVFRFAGADHDDQQILLCSLMPAHIKFMRFAGR